VYDKPKIYAMIYFSFHRLQDLEYLSIADSKLKEYTADFLLALTNNASLKILDIR
jgi:hypothetical protein